MEKVELLKSYKRFYHITPSENVKNILEVGLLPNRDDDMHYAEEAPEKKAQICLTTNKHLKGLFDQLNEFEDSVVFEISADFVSSLNTGLDWTFSQTVLLSKMDEVTALKVSIESLGTLACFDPIPKNELKLIEKLPT